MSNFSRNQLNPLQKTKREGLIDFAIAKRGCPCGMVIRELIQNSSSIFACFDKKYTKNYTFSETAMIKDFERWNFSRRSKLSFCT